MSLWLAISLAEPAQLHTCAMHGGLAIGASGHSGPHATASSHSGAATHHAAPAPDAAPADSHQDRDSHSNQCSCLGDCSVGKPPVALPGTAARVAAAAAHARQAAYDYATPTLVAPPFLLPFSNGPPAVSSRA